MTQAVGSLVDLSNRMVDVLQPRLARSPVAQSYAEYSSVMQDCLPRDIMFDAIEEINQILAK